MPLLQDIRRRIDELAAEEGRREYDALRLYRPQNDKVDQFHKSPVKQRLIRGGNGSGKSCAGYVELASAATGIPIVGLDGEPIPRKYPDPPLLIWVIGYGWDHVGDTIHRYLFEAGGSGMERIRDEETGEWRIFQPWREDDMRRHAEAEPMPALIPERFIDPNGWGWENKSLKQFKRCRLKNGTIIRAYSSTSKKPKQGDEPNIIDIDEDLADPKFVTEYTGRARSRKGCWITWHAYPWSDNEALERMSDQAFADRDMEVPDTEEIVLRFDENPYILPETKRRILKAFEAEGPDVLKARNEGQFLRGNVLMYPGWHEDVHGINLADPRPNEEHESIRAVADALRDRGGQPPGKWCRYMIVDPGFTVTAALFVTIPPPEQFGEFMIVYDELYMPNHSASMAASEIARKIAGYTFQGFIGDGHMLRQTLIGPGETVAEQYRKAFEANGIWSVDTDHSMLEGPGAGPGEVGAACSQVREAMTLRSGSGTKLDGTPRLLVVLDNTPNWQMELRKYKRYVGKEVTSDKPAPNQQDHLMDCTRYVVCANPQYVVPKRVPDEPSRAWTLFQQWQKEAKEGQDDKSYHLGPGVAA